MKHSNLALVEGEVYVLKSKGDINDYLLKTDKRIKGVLASTADLDGIPKLERKWFVKPVNVDEIATEAGKEFKNYLDFERGFIAGHNYNKAEFTMDDMYKMYIYMRTDNYGNFDDYIKEILPISLPKSINLNDDNQIISVEW